MSILDDPNKSAICRNDADFAFGILYIVEGDRELAAEYFREAIAAADNKIEKELQKTIFLNGEPDVSVRDVIRLCGRALLGI